MRITLNNIGKRYNRDWIFRGVEHTFTNDVACVILGANGSGKSTLLQVISGAYLPSEGKITYEANGAAIEAEEIYRRLSFASPYLELMEELTLEEHIRFHGRFKTFIDNLSVQELIQLAELDASKKKALRYYSSGMKQRVRLLLAVLSDTPILLLDEPCSNLDRNAIQWYRNLVENYRRDRLVIVCSNQQEDEYFFCTQQIEVERFKNN